MKPYYEQDGISLLNGDALSVLRDLPDASVSCCVTSPPYWGLRAYKAGDGEIGMEPTPDAYVAALVAVFREVRRVLRDDGTLWLNLGDAYISNGRYESDKSTYVGDLKKYDQHDPRPAGRASGLKPKDLIGLPWMVAFALRADGWYLRSDIIWAKPNPMPESVTDRPTKAHEYVFLLSKSARYFFDQDAVREPLAASSIQRMAQPNFDNQQGGAKDYANGTNANRSARQSLVNLKKRADKQRGHGRRHAGFNDRWDAMPRDEQMANGANIRTVWTIATQPSPLPHFAAFPDELAERCIKAGCPKDGTVLDPFAGTGTTLKVARELGRRAIGIDLSAEYCALARKRLTYGVKGVLAMQAGQEALL